MNCRAILVGVVLMGLSSTAWGQELASEAIAESVAPEPYNFKDPGVFKRVLDEKGIRFVKDYDFKGCLPINDSDTCLPTGYLDAIEKGEPWKSVWEAELAIREQELMKADKLLRQLDQKYPNNPKVKWLMAKNIFFRTEVMEKSAKKAKGKLLGGRGCLGQRVCGFGA